MDWKTLVGVLAFIILSVGALYGIDFAATKIRLYKRTKKHRKTTEPQTTAGYFAVSGVSTELSNYLNGEYLIMSEGRRFRQIDLIQQR